MESPGLTASLAIARHVADMAEGRLEGEAGAAARLFDAPSPPL